MVCVFVVRRRGFIVLGEGGTVGLRVEERQGG